jgi:photosystem II stability/assembly factor-like uncharacterized protein
MKRLSVIRAGTAFTDIKRCHHFKNNHIQVAITAAILLLFPQIPDAKWTKASSGGPAGCISMAILVKGRDIFLGTYYWSFHSNNLGQTWTLIDSGLPTNTGFAAWAIKDSTLFAGSNNNSGIFRSDNNGKSWIPAISGLPEHCSVPSLAVSGDRIFAGTSANGVFISTNNGESWIPAGSGLPSNSGIASLVTSGNDIFAGSSRIFLSTDNGATWTTSDSGLIPTQITALVMMGDNLFAGTSRNGLYRSTDRGKSWTSVNNMYNSLILSLGVSGNNILVGSYCMSNSECRVFPSGLWMSSDTGKSWVEPAISGIRYAAQNWINCFAAGDSGQVFAGSGNDFLFSTDYGAHWTCNDSNIFPP